MEINFLGACRFHNSTDESIRGVVLWRRALQPRLLPASSSIPRAVFKNNAWVRELKPRMLNHATTPLTRHNPMKVFPPLTKGKRKQRQVRGIQDLKGRVAESVQVRADGKHHHFLTAMSKVSRPDRVSITCWQLGLVAAHQECKKFGESLSRRHGVECAGAAGVLDGIVRAITPEERVGETEIDWAINALAEGMAPKQAEVIVKAIDMLEQACRGREQAVTGFWT